MQKTMTSKFDGTEPCPVCNGPVTKGQQIIYDTDSKRAWHAPPCPGASTPAAASSAAPAAPPGQSSATSPAIRWVKVSAKRTVLKPQHASHPVGTVVTLECGAEATVEVLGHPDVAAVEGILQVRAALNRLQEEVQ